MFGKTVYIIAVSGGVDSVVLLHMLVNRCPDDVQYIVAHFDHGIRKDSGDDALFVQKLSQNYGLECVVGHGNLGKNASEAVARKARYAFLRSVAKNNKAEKIITAHHQDDYLETIILGMLRTRSYRALRPMHGQMDIVRPLLAKPKLALIEYARKHKLTWRDDPSNTDTVYLRNYVRLHIMPRINTERETFLQLSHTLDVIADEIDSRIATLLPRTNSLSRAKFIGLPWVVQKEFMYAWLVKNAISVDQKFVERVAIAAKTLPIGKRISITKNVWMISEPENVLLTSENA